MTLPDAMRQTIVARHGDAGRQWLDDLPGLVAGYERAWGFRVGTRFGYASVNFVAPGTMADGTPVVLKLSFDRREIAPEVAALRLTEGDGLVALLREDPDGAAYLMARAVPGDMLIDHPDDEEATRIAARTMAALWRPAQADYPFATVAGWGEGFARMRARFDGGTGPLPPDLTGRAERLFADLVATSAAPVVLHGDLHHYNVLRHGDGWASIDPKGLIGEPAYEVGALMRNRHPDLRDTDQARATLLRRLAIVAEEIGLDADRMRRWTVAQAVLSAWWVVEDMGQFDWAEGAIRLAELLIRDDD